jgi:hypothetical protein
MKITAEWLESNATGGVGFTKQQMLAIGGTYPLQKGWKSRLIGKEITEEQKAKFESMKGLRVTKLGEVVPCKKRGAERERVRNSAKAKVFDESYDDGLGLPFEEGVFFMGKRVEAGSTVNPMPATKGKPINAFEFLNIGLPTAIEKKLDAAGVNGEVAGLAMKVCHFASLMSDYPIGHHLWMYHNRQRVEQLKKLCDCLLLSDAFNWGWASVNGKSALFLVTPHGIACWQSGTKFAGPKYTGVIPKKFSNAPVIAKWVQEILAWENAIAS